MDFSSVNEVVTGSNEVVGSLSVEDSEVKRLRKKTSDCDSAGSFEDEEEESEGTFSPRENDVGKSPLQNSQNAQNAHVPQNLQTTSTPSTKKKLLPKIFVKSASKSSLQTVDLQQALRDKEKRIKQLEDALKQKEKKLAHKATEEAKLRTTLKEALDKKHFFKTQCKQLRLQAAPSKSSRRLFCTRESPTLTSQTYSSDEDEIPIPNDTSDQSLEDDRTEILATGEEDLEHSVSHSPSQQATLHQQIQSPTQPPQSPHSQSQTSHQSPQLQSSCPNSPNPLHISSSQHQITSPLKKSAQAPKHKTPSAVASNPSVVDAKSKLKKMRDGRRSSWTLPLGGNALPNPTVQNSMPGLFGKDFIDDRLQELELQLAKADKQLLETKQKADERLEKLNALIKEGDMKLSQARDVTTRALQKVNITERELKKRERQIMHLRNRLANFKEEEQRKEATWLEFTKKCDMSLDHMLTLCRQVLKIAHNKECIVKFYQKHDTQELRWERSASVAYDSLCQLKRDVEKKSMQVEVLQPFVQELGQAIEYIQLPRPLEKSKSTSMLEIRSKSPERSNMIDHDQNSLEQTLEEKVDGTEDDEDDEDDDEYDEEGDEEDLTFEQVEDEEENEKISTPKLEVNSIQVEKTELEEPSVEIAREQQQKRRKLLRRGQTPLRPLLEQLVDVISETKLLSQQYQLHARKSEHKAEAEPELDESQVSGSEEKPQRQLQFSISPRDSSPPNSTPLSDLGSSLPRSALASRLSEESEFDNFTFSDEKSDKSDMTESVDVVSIAEEKNGPSPRLSSERVQLSRKETLKIIVFEARDLIWDQVDPFCKLEYGGVTKSTNVLSQCPSDMWNETFVFDLGEDKELVIQCIDRTKDGVENLIGRISIPVHTLEANKELSNWFTLQPLTKPEPSIKSRLAALLLSVEKNKTTPIHASSSFEQKAKGMPPKSPAVKRRPVRQMSAGVMQIILQNPSSGTNYAHTPVKSKKKFNLFSGSPTPVPTVPVEDRKLNPIQQAANAVPQPNLDLITNYLEKGKYKVDCDWVNDKHQTLIHLMAMKGSTKHLAMVLPQHRNPDILSIPDRFGLTPLHVASSKGHLGCVRMLLEAGANVNQEDKISGVTPLHCAALRGKRNVCEFLIENYQAKVDHLDRSNSTPLLKAAYGGYLKTVKVLVNNHGSVNAVDNDGNSPLLVAMMEGYFDVATYLRKRGASIKHSNAIGDNALWACIVHNNTSFLKMLLSEQIHENTTAESSTQHASPQPGNPGVLNITSPTNNLDWLNQSLGKYSHSLLHRCLMHLDEPNCEKILPWLVKRGLKVDSRNSEGKTPLFYAAYYQKLECMRLLIRRGANVFARDNAGNIPLHFCSSPEAAAILLDAAIYTVSGGTKVDPQSSYEDTNFSSIHNEFEDEHRVGNEIEITMVNMANNQGNTPLHAAYVFYGENMVQFLKSRGADETLRNANGNTAVEVAWAGIKKILLPFYLDDESLPECGGLYISRVN